MWQQPYLSVSGTCVTIQQTVSPVTSSLEDARLAPLPGVMTAMETSGTHHGHIRDTLTHIIDAGKLGTSEGKKVLELKSILERLEGPLIGREVFLVICAPEERTRASGEKHPIII